MQVPMWAVAFVIFENPNSVTVHFEATMDDAIAHANRVGGMGRAFDIEDLELVLSIDSVKRIIRAKQKEIGNPPSKYHIPNPGGDWLDFYAIWDALMMRRKHLLGDSAIAHAFKKMFAPGDREGNKSRLHDLKDMHWSIGRAIEQIEDAER